jgi:altronate dehydratase small subunit
MIRAIVLNSGDNVATLVDPGETGQVVALTGETTGNVTLAGNVAFGHKLATRAIAKGDTILKYGKVIGQATQAIGLGEHVHTHNVEALRARGDRKETK